MMLLALLVHAQAPPPLPPHHVSVFLLHADYGCANQGANLGTTHTTPAQCATAAMQDARCHSLGTVMFSHNYNYAWGCRCCTTSDHHFNSNPNWDLYQVASAAPMPPGPPVGWRGGSHFAPGQAHPRPPNGWG